MALKEVLYIANIRIPTEKAHGQQIMTMCYNFSKKNIILDLLVPTKFNKNFKYTEPFTYYKINKNFGFKKIFTIDPRFFLYLPGNLYLKIQALFFIISLFFYFLFHPIKNKIIYTRDEYLLPFLLTFSKNVVWEGHYLPRKIDFFKKCFIKCHKLIVLTMEMKRELVKMGIDVDKILVSPDAVDLEIFDINIDKIKARDALDLPKDKILLGYTGSLETMGLSKGVDLILQILNSLDNKFYFIAVGGDRVTIEKYKKIGENFNCLDKVLFVEKLSQEKLAIYQKACDILIMPFPDIKHYRSYMSPLKMFEYMTAKRPIVSSDLPSIREILDENCCIFYKANDEKDLLMKIKILANNQELVNKLSLNCYNKVQNFTWVKRSEQILNFIIN